MAAHQRWSAEVAALPVAPAVKLALQRSGFRTWADVRGMRPVALAEECGVSRAEALAVLAAVGSPHAEGSGVTVAARTAADVLVEERRRRGVTTFCPELDALLGGGVLPGEVTEVCGVPGVGKTQLGAQLAVSVQLPAAFGGVAGEALYVDTEGSFMLERVAEVAEAAAVHLRRVAASKGAPYEREAEGFTAERVLRGIHYVRVHDAAEQRAVTESLPALLAERPAVRLVVLDSVAFHFRQDFDDLPARTRLLAQLSQDLQRAADSHRVAVVTMNQVTTKVLGDDRAKLVPALGESFAHAATTRLVLFWEGPERRAHLFKSPRLPPGTAAFVVTADGIRALRHKRPAEEDPGVQQPPRLLPASGREGR